MSDYNDSSDEPAGTTLGDLMKEQLGNMEK